MERNNNNSNDNTRIHGTVTTFELQINHITVKAPMKNISLSFPFKE